MPASIPELMCASRSSLVGCSTRIVSVVRPSASVSVSGVQRACSRVGHALVDLGRDDPLVRDDLAVLAVEGDLESAVGHHHVAPPAADPQVDLGDRHLAALRAPPALDQLGRGPRLVHQVLGRVELPRDEDLLIRGERHRRRPATRHCPISFLLLLEVLQHDIQLVEPLRPRALVGLHPVVDGLERVAVQPVQPLPSFVTHVNRSHFSEHPQVLGHLRLSQPEHAHQVVHGALPAGEGVQDLSPPGLGHRVERIRCRRCSCHGSIYTHIGICKANVLIGDR